MKKVDNDYKVEITGEISMVTIICQHSGLKFEASSKRTKQHPKVAALKARANKLGKYRETNAALDSVAKAGGYTTIDEYIQMVGNMVNSGSKERTERQAEAEQRYQADREARKAKKKADNELLKAHGYIWRKETVDRDEYALEWRDEGNYWYLFAPDGREVTIAQAKDEIERGVEVVKQEREAIAQAARDKKAREQEQEARDEKHNNTELNRLDELADRIRETTIEVEPEWTVLRMAIILHQPEMRGKSTYRRYDLIKIGRWNGQRVYIIIRGTGYDDDGYCEFRTPDPEKAGLTAKPQRDEQHRSFF